MDLYYTFVFKIYDITTDAEAKEHSDAIIEEALHSIDQSHDGELCSSNYSQTLRLHPNDCQHLNIKGAGRGDFYCPDCQTYR